MIPGKKMKLAFPPRMLEKEQATNPSFTIAKSTTDPVSWGLEAGWLSALETHYKSALI